MRANAKVAVLIPAFNEEKSIAKVVAAIPEWTDDIIVVNNGSTDRTAEIAQSCGARVFFEPRRGYGRACLAGIRSLEDPDIVVFLDGDFSDYPEEMDRLVDPIIKNQADLVIGSRISGKLERGAIKPQARFGNWLSCFFIRLFWGVRYTDLGPFRAITYQALKFLDMRDTNYGWTVEMQVKAAQRGLRSMEAPVSYRTRIGRSKVSGTLKGVVFAGGKILYTIFMCALDQIHPR
jgi:glycosyltransferase involved in cell wall biosynthesis